MLPEKRIGNHHTGVQFYQQKKAASNCEIQVGTRRVEEFCLLGYSAMYESQLRCLENKSLQENMKSQPCKIPVLSREQGS
jgi:hypothetical protein